MTTDYALIRIQRNLDRAAVAQNFKLMRLSCYFVDKAGADIDLLQNRGVAVNVKTLAIWLGLETHAYNYTITSESANERHSYPVR